MTILSCKGFTLRPYKKGDETSLQRNISDKAIHRYMSTRIPYPYRMKDAKDWIKRNIAESKKRKKSYITFAIDINGDVLGGSSLMNIDGHKAELGYWLAKKYWNKGITTQAVKRITQFGFSKLKLKRIYATVFSPNKASARVLEKTGYKYEGKLRKFYKKDGRLIDALLYAKVK